MRLRALVSVTALAVATLPFLATSAVSADTTLGETFTIGADDGSCGDGVVVLQTSPASYQTPTAGVITSWRTSTPSPYVVGFRVGRRAAGAWAVVGSGPATTLPAGASQHLVRIPVQAGDVIGLDIPVQPDGAAAFCGRAADDSYTFAIGAAGGQTAEQVSGAAANVQLNVAATVEPDADRDGFGDTTQDRCSTQVLTQGACQDLVSPETTISSATAKKIKPAQQGQQSKQGTQGKQGKKARKAKARVTVTFTADEAATFSCAVDGGAYRACSSPLQVRLGRGRHSIAVQATDAAGIPDATPATTKVKVKVKKARRR